MNTPNNEDVLIVGAGPAGMACAMELYKTGAGFRIVEKDDQVGGLAKTYRFGEFLTDNGSHRFITQNKYLYGFIEDILGEGWLKVDRFSSFYIKGKFYKYPVEWKDALMKMGPVTALRAFVDFLFSKAASRGREPSNFEEYALSSFGRTLAEMNVLNYTEKIWGLPCRELSVDWAKQRIKGLTLWSLISNIFKRKGGPKTLVSQFYYPEHGAGAIYEAIKKKIEGSHPVMFSKEPEVISHNDGMITEVTLKTGEAFSPNFLVSSVPITEFVGLLDPAPPDAVYDASRKLRFRSQVYLFITINKPQVSKDQWVYFPEEHIPFGRISEMKNFSARMAPPDKTSLFIEFFCWEDDEVWNKAKDELVEISTQWLERLGFIKKEEIINAYHIKRKNVYPVYELGYKNNLRVVNEYLDKFSNLLYIGRPGRFKYTNQDHSLEMGILAARSIIEGKKYNLEDIGAESEYFERGYVK